MLLLLPRKVFVFLEEAFDTFSFPISRSLFGADSVELDS